MGSERKKMNKERDTTHSDSEQEDDRKSKRRRLERDEEPKSSKRDKSKKKRHHSEKEKKSKEKRKSKHDKHVNLPDNLTIPELSSDDYFSKNNEFATWLKKEKDVFFSDLGSDSARKLFSKFVEKWNSKKLELQYYEGIETAPRSAHKWKIKQ